MKPFVWLRIASGLFAFFTLGHTYGFNFAPGHGPEEVKLFEAMRAFPFVEQGFTRTQWDFLRGFGHLTTVLVALLAVLAWQVGQLSRSNPQTARPLALTLLIASTVIAILGWAFFFTAPAGTATLATLCLLGAWLSLGRA